MMICRTSLLTVALALLIHHNTGLAQTVRRDIKTPEYAALQARLAKGWNTWYNNSVMSFVHLPEGFSVNLCLSGEGGGDYLRETFKTNKTAQHRPEDVRLGLRSDDGSYTSMAINYKDARLEIQSATDGVDELILVTPLQPSEEDMVVEAGMLWGLPGRVGMDHDRLTGQNIMVGTTGEKRENAYAVTSAPHLTVALKKEFCVYTGHPRTLAYVKNLIDKRRKIQEQRAIQYGELAQAFTAMQTILAWNTIYDAPNHRVITPVSRVWSNGWGGFVLFDWDTYFASMMCALFNKDLAYANAIEITKAITPHGFIPNYEAAFGNTSWDRSQPPIGTTIIMEIYKRYKEQWLLREVYDELLTWNRWWPEHRDRKGYLAWGSDEVPDSLKSIDKHDLQAARYESGLDNSPMYDSVPFNPQTNTMELADVGLMSLYIMDCNALAEMSDILGKTAEAREIRQRADKYRASLATLWDEGMGIFLNKRLDTDQKSPRLSPTNFYPMLAQACTQAQAERMIKEHYYNPAEFYGEYILPSATRNDPAFKDNDYWRGRIWGPMNFLVYLGMRHYDLAEARADLIAKSGALLMKSWQANGAIYENYNSVTGQGDDVGSADGFYHWGALLTFMAFMEKGYFGNKP